MQTPNHQLIGAFMLGMYISNKRPLQPLERWIFDELTSSHPSEIMQGILDKVGREASEKINEDR